VSLSPAKNFANDNSTVEKNFAGVNDTGKKSVDNSSLPVSPKEELFEN